MRAGQSPAPRAGGDVCPYILLPKTAHAWRINTIALLTGMMVIVNITRKSGVFHPVIL